METSAAHAGKPHGTSSPGRHDAVRAPPTAHGPIYAPDVVDHPTLPLASSRAATGPSLPVEIRTSRRRVRTVMARREADRYVVVAPATMPPEERERTAAQLVERLERRLARRATDELDLLRRAADLSRRYLGGRAHPRSVSWVDNQHHRWGSATPTTRTIRLSSELTGMPTWVVDSVLVHELAHLLVADHGPSFQRLVAAYPRTAEARAFLAGVSWARSRNVDPLPPP